MTARAHHWSPLGVFGSGCRWPAGRSRWPRWCGQSRTQFQVVAHAAREAGGAEHVVAAAAAVPPVGDLVVGRRQQTGHVADSVGRRGAAALAATVVPLGAVGRAGALGGRQMNTPLITGRGGRTDGRRVGRREAPRGVTVPRRLGGSRSARRSWSSPGSGRGQCGTGGTAVRRSSDHGQSVNVYAEHAVAEVAEQPAK